MDSVISKLSVVYNAFIKSIVNGSLERMKPVGMSEYQPSLS